MILRPPIKFFFCYLIFCMSQYLQNLLNQTHQQNRHDFQNYFKQYFASESALPKFCRAAVEERLMKKKCLNGRNILSFFNTYILSNPQPSLTIFVHWDFDFVTLISILNIHLDCIFNSVSEKHNIRESQAALLRCSQEKVF